MKILIDGYNLIFHCGFNSNVSSPQSIQRSRYRLLDTLAKLLPLSERLKTTIVFDAKKLPQSESSITSRKQDMTVIFSVGYDEADSLIEELIANHSHPKDLLVVSSDHRLQNAARRRRAMFIDSDRWMDQLESISEEPIGANPDRQSLPQNANLPLKDASLSEEEKQAWFDLFSDADSDAFEEPRTTSSKSKAPPQPEPQDPFTEGMLELDEELERLLKEEEADDEQS